MQPETPAKPDLPVDPSAWASWGVHLYVDRGSLPAEVLSGEIIDVHFDGDDRPVSVGIRTRTAFLVIPWHRIVQASATSAPEWMR